METNNNEILDTPIPTIDKKIRTNDIIGLEIVIVVLQLTLIPFVALLFLADNQLSRVQFIEFSSCVYASIFFVIYTLPLIYMIFWRRLSIRYDQGKLKDTKRLLNPYLLFLARITFVLGITATPIFVGFGYISYVLKTTQRARTINKKEGNT